MGRRMGLRMGMGMELRRLVKRSTERCCCCFCCLLAACNRIRCHCQAICDLDTLSVPKIVPARSPRCFKNNNTPASRDRLTGPVVRWAGTAAAAAHTYVCHMFVHEAMPVSGTDPAAAAAAAVAATGRGAAAAAAAELMRRQLRLRLRLWRL